MEKKINRLIFQPYVKMVDKLASYRYCFLEGRYSDYITATIEEIINFSNRETNSEGNYVIDSVFENKSYEELFELFLKNDRKNIIFW